MAVNLSALAGAGQQFFDNNGNPLTGGKLYSYASGTTTPQTTYSSASGSTPLTNPIILDSAGRVPTGEIWLTAGSNYKFVLSTATDVILATWDNVTGINGTGITSNASNVTYDPAGTGAVATTVQAKLREIVSVTDFGAVGDGVTDDTVAIQNALNTGKNISFGNNNDVYAVSDQLNIVTANQVICGSGKILQTVPNKITISASNVDGVVISGITIRPGLNHASARSDAISFSDCSYVNILETVIDWAGCTQAQNGIRLVNCDYPTIQNNRFVNAPSTTGVYFTAGGADIAIEESSSYAKVSANNCVSGNVYGINVTTSTNAPARGHTIIGNTVKGCTAYGIILYRGSAATAAADFSSHVVAYNIVDNITGGATALPSPSTECWFGGGIYIQMATNCKVIGNVVKNTAQLNNAGSLPIAGICGTTVSCQVIGNTVENSYQRGYYFSAGNASATYPALIGEILLMSGNNSINSTKEAYKIFNARRLDMAQTTCSVSGTGSAISIDTNGDWKTSLTLGETNIYAFSGGGVSVNNASTASIDNLTVDTTSATGLSVANTDYLNLTSVNFTNITGNALSIAATVTDGVMDGIIFESVTGTAGVMSGNISIGKVIFGTVGTKWAGTYIGSTRTLTATATPSVVNGNTFFTSGSTTITTFNGGDIGDIVTITALGSITLQNGSPGLNLKGGVDFNMVGGNIITLQRYNTTTWKEVSRNV